MALIFVTVYTIGELSGGFDDCYHDDETLMRLCGIKYAVFLQSVSLLGSMPVLLVQSDAFHNSNPALLQTLVPITLISTPIGQYYQTIISASWIKVVVGIVVIVAVLYQLMLDVLVERRRQQETATPTTTSGEINSIATHEQTPLLAATGSATATDKNVNDENRDTNYHGFSANSIRIWGILLGGSSGFLGGLIGMRGPPLMIFFLAFPFPKSEARAIGTILLGLNLILRMGYYVVSDVMLSLQRYSKEDNLGGDTPLRQWFYTSEWLLYAFVIVTGIVAVFLGDYVHHQLDHASFQRVLVLILIATGVVNIWKGTSELLHPGEEE